MTKNYAFDVPMRDVVRPRRQVSGTQKLRDSLSRVHETIDKLSESIDRFAESKARADAVRYLTDPPAEVQAMRDRAAFDQAWAARNEHQRQQLRDMNKRAAEFYGRTGR